MRDIGRDFRTAVVSPVPYVVWASLSVILTIAGPFHTYEGTTWQTRGLLWAGIVALSIVIGRSLRILLEVWLKHATEPVRRFAPVPVVAVVLGPLLWAYASLFPSIQPIHPAWFFVAMVFFVSFSVQLALVAIKHHVRRHGTLGSRDVQVRLASDDDGVPRLVQRLVPNVQGAVHRVAARNHYLDVFTDKGRAEILLRFSDAVAELDGADGAQVHRSHWVAWDAVDGAERDGTRVFLRMVDGARVPVSQRFLTLVEARNLMPDD